MKHYFWVMILLLSLFSFEGQAQPAMTSDKDSSALEPLYDGAENVVEYVSYDDTVHPVSNLTHEIFKIIFVLISIYLIFIFITPFFVQFVNVYRKFVAKRRLSISTIYKEKIFEYLVSDNNTGHSTIQLQGLNKRVLLEVLYDLIRYVEGDDRDKLLQIYTQFGLEKQLLFRIKYSLFNKSYFLKMLSSLSSSTHSLGLIEQMIKHRNSEIRMYATQAYFAIQPEQVYAYFENYDSELSQWEQINYYHFFKTRHIAVPNFHGLLLSNNDSVVMFAARMIRLFHQKRGNIQGFEHLQDHPNILVQIELLRILAEFGYKDLTAIMPDLMTRVDTYIKQHIITYLSKLEGANTEQLMAYYDADESPDFRLHVLYTIYNFVPKGADDIVRFSNQPQNAQLRQLSLHLINNLL